MENYNNNIIQNFNFNFNLDLLMDEFIIDAYNESAAENNFYLVHYLSKMIGKITMHIHTHMRARMRACVHANKHAHTRPSTPRHVPNPPKLARPYLQIIALAHQLINHASLFI